MPRSLVTLALLSGFAEATAQCPATATDVDGNVYTVIQYGTQCWMGSNLRTTKYRNGSTIPNASASGTWDAISTGAWAYYDNSSAYNAVHGKLYNWFAIDDPRGLCPSGWWVPSDLEWKELELFLGMPSDEINWFSVRGADENVGGRMKIDNGTWFDPNQNVTNQSGFSATPAGSRTPDGVFNALGNRTQFWTSTDASSFDPLAIVRDLDHFWAGISRAMETHRWGYSCRCVRGLSLVGVEEAQVDAERFEIFQAQDAQGLITRWNGQPAILELIDVSGRVITEEGIATGTTHLSVVGLTPGIYIARLNAQGKFSSVRVLVE